MYSERLSIPYGKAFIELKCQSPPAQVFHPATPQLLMGEQAFKNKVLPHLLQCELRDVAIVVSDKSRVCDYARLLPMLESLLLELASQRLTFYVAYGTHAKQSDAESLLNYGSIYERYDFVHHDCSGGTAFTELGQTSRGTPLRLRADLLEHSTIISFGAISHHYFAGFGGGRKLLFPGLAEREAIYHNHALFVHGPEGLSPECQPGQLEGNPLAEDLKEIYELGPQCLGIHGLLNDHMGVVDCEVGTSYADFLRACRRHAQFYQGPGNVSFPLVLASAGGYPKDLNFIQSHKSLHHGARLVEDGGTLILFAACNDGIGSSSFLPWFKMGYEAALETLSQNYVGNGGTALAMMEKSKRIHMFLVTELDAQTCLDAGVKKVGLLEVQEKIRQVQFNYCYVPSASLFVP